MGEPLLHPSLNDARECVSKEKRKDETRGGGRDVCRPRRDKGAWQVCHRTVISALEKPGRRRGWDIGPHGAEPHSEGIGTLLEGSVRGEVWSVLGLVKSFSWGG